MTIPYPPDPGAASVLYDAAYDLILDGLPETLEQIVASGLSIIGWKPHGPGGGNPMATTRGTRDAHLAWLAAFYDFDRNSIGDVVVEGILTWDGDLLTTDDAIWRACDEIFHFRPVTQEQG